MKIYFKLILMKKVILLAIFLITVGTKAQENSIELTKNQEVLKCFPASWEGNYEGKLLIYGVDKVRMQLPMELKIVEKTDSVYSWSLIYKMKGKPTDVRAYEVKIVDKNKGHYQIDEKNSIVIDAFLHNNIFTSFFKVMDNFIVATYTQLDIETIQFEIISATDKKKTLTGNTTIDGEKIPEVVTNFINGRQKAILKKIK